MKDKDVFNQRGRTEWLSLIFEYVHNETDRQLITRHYLDGICFEPLAEEFNLSTVQCQTRVHKAKKQLFSHIKT